MLGSAVSSSTPKDFQPSSHMGVSGPCPLMNRHARSGVTCGCPYPAVGMQRALHSAIGLPSRSMSALWMLMFLMPAEVRRYFMVPLLADVMGAERLRSTPIIAHMCGRRVTVRASERRGYNSCHG